MELKWKKFDKSTILQEDRLYLFRTDSERIISMIHPEYNNKLEKFIVDQQGRSEVIAYLKVEDLLNLPFEEENTKNIDRRISGAGC